MTQKETLVKNPGISLAEIGEHIGFEKGAKMVKDYYDAFGENSCHFVGRNILLKMLEQPDCVGVNMYKALNDQGNPTYVFVGVDSTGKAILEYTAVNDGGNLAKEIGLVTNRFSKKDGWWSWDFEDIGIKVK